MHSAVVCGRRLDHPAADRAEPRYPIPRCHDARDCDLASCGAHLRRWADHVARQRLDARLAELDDEHADDLAAAIAYLENPRDNDAALRLVRRGVYRWCADGSPAVTCADRAGVDLMRRAAAALATGTPALF